MIKVETANGTIYIIDEENKQIKRIPHDNTKLSSILRGFINIGKFQPYSSFVKDELKLGGQLLVTYPNEQNWSVSSSIKSIEYNFIEDPKED